MSGKDLTRHEMRARLLRTASRARVSGAAPSKATRRIQRRAHIIARSGIESLIRAAQVERAHGVS